MKIIHNLKDKVNRLVGIFIPKQDSGSGIDVAFRREGYS